MDYSYSYWNDDPDGPEGLWQADAAGFLYGWAVAVYKDYQDDGNVYAEDQWKRLQAGAEVGIGFSLGNKKWR